MNETNTGLRPQPLGAEWCSKCRLMTLPVIGNWDQGKAKRFWACPKCNTATVAKES